MLIDLGIRIIMHTRFLTKSRFQLAIECPAKLFYQGKPEYSNHKLKDTFLKLGQFFRVVDDDNLLSLTNLVIFVAIYKIIVAPVFTITEVTSLLISMLAYGYKRHVNKKRKEVTDEQKQAIADLTTKVQQATDRIGGVAAMVGIKNLK